MIMHPIVSVRNAITGWLSIPENMSKVRCFEVCEETYDFIKIYCTAYYIENKELPKPDESCIVYECNSNFFKIKLKA